MSRADSSTLADIVIDYEHHEIHSNSHFFNEDNAELDNLITLNIGMRTADTRKWVNLVWEILSQGIITFQVFEAANITWDGTDLTAYNNNRNSLDTSNLVEFQRNPTVVSPGTLLSEAIIGDSTNPNQGIPGGGQRNREIILRQNTSYLFRIISGVNGNILTYLAEWYEHTDKVQAP